MSPFDTHFACDTTTQAEILRADAQALRQFEREIRQKLRQYNTDIPARFSEGLLFLSNMYRIKLALEEQPGGRLSIDFETEGELRNAKNSAKFYQSVIDAVAATPAQHNGDFMEWLRNRDESFDRIIAL